VKKDLVLEDFLKKMTLFGHKKEEGIPYCAADFALLNLPKGKSLGRSKPATNSSNEQAH
jgi:hypothetical protein